MAEMILQMQKEMLSMPYKMPINGGYTLQIETVIQIEHGTIF